MSDEGPVTTVTANPAVDRTAWVPGFRAGAVNRVVREHVVAGGKGVNVATVLAGLGVATVATGFLGAGNADVFRAHLAARGIADRFVVVPGTTRTGIKVVDEVAGATTDLNFPGVPVAAGDVEALEAVVRAEAAPGRWVVLAGSLPVGAPDDLWARLTRVVRAGGGRVALDASGPALAAAVREVPDLAKPNRDELEELVGRALDGPAAVLAAARELGARGIGTVVVSMGAEGALFVRDGEAVHARPPAVRVASTVGAGDAMVAGTVLGALRGLGLAGAAALATACSAVAVAGVGSDLDPGAVADAAAAVGLEDVGGADPGADDEGAGGMPAMPAGWPDRHGRRGSGA